MKTSKTAKLQERLESYSPLRTGILKKTLRERAGRWPCYAAVTSSALATATSASASIITYLPASPVTVSQAGNGSAGKSIAIPNAPPFRLSVIHEDLSGPFGSHTSEGRVSGGNGRGVTYQHLRLLDTGVVGNGFPRDLGSGVSVGPAAGFFERKTSGGLLKGAFKAAGPFGFSGHSGLWNASSKGFEGFEFTTNKGQTDYGWAELSFGVDGNGFSDSVTLYGLAYDSTGASILTGETSAPGGGSTPEPGTAGMMLLALGAAGVTVLRRSRQEIKQSSR